MTRSEKIEMLVSQPVMKFDRYIAGARVFTIDMPFGRGIFGLPEFKLTDADAWIHEVIEHSISSFLEQDKKIWYIFKMSLPHLMTSLVTNSGYVKDGINGIEELTPDEFWVEFRRHIQRMKDLD